MEPMKLPTPALGVVALVRAAVGGLGGGVARTRSRQALI